MKDSEITDDQLDALINTPESDTAPEFSFDDHLGDHDGLLQQLTYGDSPVKEIERSSFGTDFLLPGEKSTGRDFLTGKPLVEAPRPLSIAGLRTDRRFDNFPSAQNVIGSGNLAPANPQESQGLDALQTRSQVTLPSAPVITSQPIVAPTKPGQYATPPAVPSQPFAAPISLNIRPEVTKQNVAKSLFPRYPNGR